MAGRVFAVVGPSGAGKDTLIAAARAARPALHVVRRVITRPEEAGGEPFEGVTEAEFAARAEAGAFCLAWRAHGLDYGIPASAIDAIAQGRDVVFNGSRAMLAEAWGVFPNLAVILVTAPIQVLAERLALRGRETAPDIAARLARARYEVPPGIPVRVVQNGGSLAEAEAAFLAALAPEGVAR
ncbi:MAG: phosphonate metabolism protein/1,5-bisphosphokinase (PRPP-forming) PhnN [Paracoccaceae bacterium]|nr:MAG: phosphonate metabolism protein/1,5-bisphosphokinase (PRPP-forming) PhnN [Paracoccaceae bacterium]